MAVYLNVQILRLEAFLSVRENEHAEAPGNYGRYGPIPAL
jgi:hypothetical protein